MAPASPPFSLSSRTKTGNLFAAISCSASSVWAGRAKITRRCGVGAACTVWVCGCVAWWLHGSCPRPPCVPLYSDSPSFVPVVSLLQFYEFRKRFHKLYYRFKPKYYYWTSVILARKFLIVVVTVFLHDNPALQASCAILILFLSYSIHMRVLPYLRNDLLMNLSPDVDGATPAHPLIANIVNAKRDHHRLNHTRSSGLGANSDAVNESGSNRVVPNYGGRKKGGSQDDKDDDHPHSEGNLTHLMSLVNSNPDNISIVSTLRKGVSNVVRKKRPPNGASGRAHSKSLGGKALGPTRQPSVMWAHREDVSWSCKKNDESNGIVHTTHSLPGRMHHSHSSPARAESTAREVEADEEGGAAAAAAEAMEKEHFRPLGAASARRKTQRSTLGGKRGGGDGENGAESASQHEAKEDGDTDELVDTFGEPMDDDRNKSPMVRRPTGHTGEFKSYRHSNANAESSNCDASAPEEKEQSKGGSVVRTVGGKSPKMTRSFSKRISNTVAGMVGESARDASVNHLKQSKVRCSLAASHRMYAQVPETKQPRAPTAKNTATKAVTNTTCSLLSRSQRRRLNHNPLLATASFSHSFSLHTALCSAPLRTRSTL